MEARATVAGATAIKKVARLACAFALFLSWAVASALPAAAQCTARNTAFLPGEQVSYELMFNWKFIWIKVGTAELTSDTANYKGNPGYCFRLKSLTSKRADFFFKMRDTLTCYVSNRLEPLYFCKAAEEGKRHTKDEAWFSYVDGKSHVKQQRTWYKPARETILGQARSWRAEDYKVGDKIHFPMATGRRVEQQTLIYRGIENVEAKDDHTYRCLVFSFVEYDEKGKENEVITFFISDDDNHLPIRLDMYLSFGSAKAFFSGVKGNRYPLKSLVK